jgi:hypothetical protein
MARQLVDQVHTHCQYRLLLQGEEGLGHCLTTDGTMDAGCAFELLNALKYMAHCASTPDVACRCLGEARGSQFGCSSSRAPH